MDYILVLVAYCFGSVSSAIIICMLTGLDDPRNSGSNNPGATNVLRIGGKKAAAITLLGDLLKGLAPILIARAISDDSLLIALCGFAAFAGHLFPVFFRFRGGKGVATAAGVLIGINWKLALSALIIWFAVVLITRYSSLSALVAAACAPFISQWLLHNRHYTLLCVAIALLLAWRHRTNIQRLITGSEPRVGGKKPMIPPG